MCLEGDRKVKQQNGQVTTIITICNYDKYQGMSKQQTKQQKDSRKTADETHNKKNKKDKNNTVAKATGAVAPVVVKPAIQELIDFRAIWKEIYGSNPTGGRVKVDYPMRWLIDNYGLEKITAVLRWVERARLSSKYIPTINNPLDLKEKWNGLVAAAQRMRHDKEVKKSKLSSYEDERDI